MENSNSTTSKRIKEEHAGFLIEFIKEDRNEIRAIKNRIYTYMQALLVASFAVTAFLMKDGKDSWPIDLLIAVVNFLFGGISWIIFLLLNDDLYFVRKCLNNRQEVLKEICVDFFKFPKEENSKEEKPEDTNLPSWVLSFIKHYHFKNDGLPFLLMLVLTAIYVLLIIYFGIHLL